VILFIGLVFLTAVIWAIMSGRLQRGLFRILSGKEQRPAAMVDHLAIKHTLKELIALLRAAHENEWVQYLEDARQGLERPELTSRDAALDILRSRSVFGGMGSLNDLVFSPYNDNVPAGYSYETANRALRDLLSLLHSEVYPSAQ
jgi:hypothetical protein